MSSDPKPELTPLPDYFGRKAVLVGGSRPAGSPPLMEPKGPVLHTTQEEEALAEQERRRKAAGKGSTE